MTFETDLRDRLDAAAWHGAVPGDDLAAADAVIARRLAERRNRAVLATAGVCLLLVLVGVPVVTGQWPGGSRPVTPLAAPSSTSTGIWADPPRGSLSRDSAFLSAVLTRRWRDVPGHPGPARDRRVAFAGDVSGIRWVLVAGRLDDQLAGQWFTGTAGASAEELHDDGVDWPLPAGLPISDVRADATGATLLVAARPGDDVQVSGGVTVDASGKVRRAYSSIDTRDGVALVREAGPYAGVSLRYRVLRDGILAGTGPPYSASGSPVQVAAVGAGQAPRRPGTGTPSASAIALAVGNVLTATGFAPGDVDPVLLWAGPVPAPGGTTSPGTVVAMTMPSGAIVTSTAVEDPPRSDDPARGVCGSAVHPAGTALDDVVVVAGCEVSTRSGTERSFVVTAPAGYDRMTLRSDDGRILATHDLVNGSASVPDPGTVATAVLAGPGRATVEVAPADPRYDVLDVN